VKVGGLGLEPEAFVDPQTGALRVHTLRAGEEKSAVTYLQQIREAIADELGQLRVALVEALVGGVFDR
jgi:hypothetical protein